LPTEAEWEKAARGLDGAIFPWGDQPPSAVRANYDNQVGDTQPVGSYPEGSGPYGLWDMSGNVAEWVADWYDQDYYQQGSLRNPTGPAAGTFRVLRGGSWFNAAHAIRAAFRLWNLPDVRSDSIGFRCAH
jgi:formylglycine-generating enzyme required for sulfatase activity